MTWALKYQYGILFNKPPGSLSAFWHQDGALWKSDIAYQQPSPEVTILVYLQDTTVKNGCLRIIPGSHSKAHPLHEYLEKTDTKNLRKTYDPEAAAFQHQPGEVSVPIKKGDILVIDSRVLHATHHNQSDKNRTLVSMWYHPEFANLPESVKAKYTGDHALNSRLPFIPNNWSDSARERLAQHIPPVYCGSAQPITSNYYPDLKRMT